MKPEIKASITLPFSITLIVSVLYLIATHPIIFALMLIIPSVILIIGSLWYGLYVMFGGEVE
jgi:hypothetical protein